MSVSNADLLGNLHGELLNLRIQDTGRQRYVKPSNKVSKKTWFSRRNAALRRADQPGDVSEPCVAAVSVDAKALDLKYSLAISIASCLIALMFGLAPAVGIIGFAFGSTVAHSTAIYSLRRAQVLASGQKIDTRNSG